MLKKLPITRERSLIVGAIRCAISTGARAQICQKTRPAAFLDFLSELPHGFRGHYPTLATRKGLASKRFLHGVLFGVETSAFNRALRESLPVRRADVLRA
jgi:hypothetical protein